MHTAFDVFKWIMIITAGNLISEGIMTAYEVWKGKHNDSSSD